MKERQAGWAGTAFFGRELGVSALLVLVSFAAFAPAARHGFLGFDDAGYVFENPHVRAGLTAEGTAWAFTSLAQANWHPLTWLSHMADAQLFGVDGEWLGLPSSGWHHLVNVALHALNAVLLFLFLRAATGSLWRAGLVAALFALHPLHVESVAWASERKDVLSTAFGFGCLLAYVGYARAPSPRRWLLVFGLLALGLMAKPMLVTWPFLLLVLDAWPLRRVEAAGGWGPLVREKLPLVALVAASSLVTLLAQRPAMSLSEVVPFPHRLENALVATATYVVKLVWPTNLAIIYPYPRDLPWAQTLGAASLIAVLTLVALRGRRARPYLAAGWLWFLGTLVPVLGLIQVGLAARADRYTYVPAVGLFIAAAWALGELAARWPRLRAPVVAAGLVALLGCALATRHQLGFWTDTVTLFQRACAVTQDNGWAHRIVGTALAQQGRTAEAVREYQAALVRWPEDPVARNNLGQALEAEGRADEALLEYAEAVRLDPTGAAYHRNLGRALARGGRLDEALAAFREVVRLAADDAGAHDELGQLLALAGRADEALAEFRRAVALSPDATGPRFNLALTLRDRGDTAAASDELRELLRRDPGDVEARSALAAIEARDVKLGKSPLGLHEGPTKQP